MMKYCACVIAALAGFSLNGAFGQTAASENFPGLDAGKALSASLEQAPAMAKKPDRQAPPPGGNPLWGVPLSALSATRERPIFTASRRPPAPPPPPVAAAVAPPPPPPPPAPLEPPPFTLVGTALGKPQSVALLLDQSTKALVRLRVGEAANGWHLRAVESRSMTLEKDRQVVTLSLPQPDQAGESNPEALNVASGFGRAF